MKTLLPIQRCMAITSKASIPRPLARLLLTVATVLCILLYPPSAISANPEGIPKVLNVGYSSRVFADSDTRDAEIAMGLWSRELSRSMGLNTTPNTIIFKTKEEIREAVRREAINIISLSALEFLEIRDTVPLTPIIIASNNRGSEREQLLIVRNNSRIKNILDLRDKTIFLPPAGKYQASHIWLNVLLLRKGFRSSASFFRQIKEASKPSQAIMSLFFGTIDAVIVSRGAFDTARTLNPQLGQRLAIIAESKSLVGDITCIPSSTDALFRNVIETAALNLHKTTIGRQIFTLFQIDRVIPYHQEYLSGLENLLKERDQLQRKSGRKP